MKRIAVVLGCAVLLCGCSEKKSELPDSEQDKPNITTTIEATNKAYDKIQVDGLTVICEQDRIRITKNGSEVQTLNPNVADHMYGNFIIDVQDIDMDGKDDLFIRDSFNSDLNEGIYYVYDKAKDRFVATTMYRRLVPTEECDYLKSFGLDGLFVDDKMNTLELFKREGLEFELCGRLLRRDKKIFQLYISGGYEYNGEVSGDAVRNGVEYHLNNDSIVVSGEYGDELETIKGDFSIGGNLCVKDLDFDSYNDIFLDTLDGHAVYFHYDPAEQKYVAWDELNKYDEVFRVDNSDKTLYSGGVNQYLNFGLGVMNKYRWNDSSLKFAEERRLTQDFTGGKYKIECYDSDGKLFRTETTDNIPEIWKS